MFFSLGLNNNNSETRFNKNLLSLKLNVFNFLNNFMFDGSRLKSLFPPLRDAKIFNITNLELKNGPIVCAADDLELNFAGSNDQIEFFSNFISSTSSDSGSSEISMSALSYDNDLSMNQSAVHSAGLNNSHKQAPSHQAHQSFQFDQFYDFNYKGLTNEAAVKNDFNHSHYNLNMIGLYNSSSYFNDFNTNKRGRDLSNNLGSASDSFVNPLDEKFFNKRANSQSAIPEKKRKFESVSSETSDSLHRDSYSSLSSDAFYEVDDIFNAMLVKNQADFQYVPRSQESRFQPQIQGDNVKMKKPKQEFIDKEDLQFKCPHCDAKFKVKGYLTRHLKKHNSSKAFVCPFYEEPRQGCAGSKCHPTGGFSRRDTYKTHLKALHFIYPPGTKSNKRNMISGRCAGCFKHFENNFKWLEEHIENGECTGAVGFKDNHSKASGSMDPHSHSLKIKMEI